MVAADAGPMGIEWMEGTVWRWAGSARGDTTDDMGRRTVVRVASLLAMDDREKREGEVYCPRRRTGTKSAEAPPNIRSIDCRLMRRP